MNKLNARELNLGHFKLRLNFSSDRSQCLGMDFEERGFFLTGEEVAFNLEIESKLDEPTEKLFLVMWTYSGLTTTHYIVSRLGPLDRKKYELSSEWLVSPGMPQYRCSSKYLGEDAIEKIEERYMKSFYPKPSEITAEISEDDGTRNAIERVIDGEITNNLVSPQIGKKLAKTRIHTLGSYSVRDRAQYKHEKTLRKSRENHQKWMKLYTAALVIFAILGILLRVEPVMNFLANLF